MFIGHFGVSMGAKKTAPGLSLGTLIMASIFLDLLWPVFLLLGWEHVAIAPGITEMTPLDFSDYPWSHSLVMALFWAVVFGLGYYLFKRNSRNAIVAGLVVFSHWVLDLLVHRPDLPLWPGDSPVVGLGMWDHPVMELVLESFIFILGLKFYLDTAKPKTRGARIGFWSFVIFVLLIFISNIFGPPPSDAASLGWMGLSLWILVIWGYLVDR